ncbi:hypothetical protein evm_015327 [Chilo suppressalis]|nr:hypothetical protein evm_015327 [Chilo suppressalis]
MTQVRCVVSKYFENRKAMRETRRRQQLRREVSRHFKNSQTMRETRRCQQLRRVVSKHLETRKATRETCHRPQSLFRNNSRSTFDVRPSTSTSSWRFRSRSEGTQTRLSMKPLRWSRNHLHYRSTETGVSMPNIRMNRRPTGTATDASLVMLRRFSDYSTVTHAHVSEPCRIHNCMLRYSDSRILCPRHRETRT